MMFINEKSKLLLNGLLIPDFSYNSIIKYKLDCKDEVMRNF